MLRRRPPLWPIIEQMMDNCVRRKEKRTRMVSASSTQRRMSLLLKEQCACDEEWNERFSGAPCCLEYHHATWNEVGFHPTLVAPGRGPREGPAGVQAWC